MKIKGKGKFKLAFIVAFLFTLMLFLLGPAEIYFSNYRQFNFVFHDFFWAFLAIALVSSFVFALLVSYVNCVVYRVIISILFGISLVSYLQIMFFNKGIELLGANPEGYIAQKGVVMVNICIWGVIIGIILKIAFSTENMWKKVVWGGSGFLIAMQLAALIFVCFFSEDEAYKRISQGKQVYLSGEEQYVVSSKENIIVLVLDFFSNQYIYELDEQYPEAIGFLKDFTYYNNTDCTYYGTFPSLIHMLTGNSVDPSIYINDWIKESWNNEKTTMFYSNLKKNGYKTNIFTIGQEELCGNNGLGVLGEKVSNIKEDERKILVDYKALIKTMSKMSAYRMAPDLIKNIFYTTDDEYYNIVQLEDNIAYDNHEYYKKLKEERITTDDNSKYFIVQHLQGPHSYTIDKNAEYKENATRVETVKGCMTIVEEYLEQLKEIGVYDNSTIVITSDHGGPDDSQVIFYIKKSGEKREKMEVTNAPISHKELLPTIAQAAGMNYEKFGNTIDEFEEDELRERTVYIRTWDDNYPYVPYHVGERVATANVYYAYTYEGGYEELVKQMQIGPSYIVPMKDAMY